MDNPTAPMILRDHLNASLVGIFSCLKGSVLDMFDDCCLNKFGPSLSAEAVAWKAQSVARRNRVREDRAMSMTMAAHSALLRFAPQGAAVHMGTATDVQFPKPSWWIDSDNYRLSPKATVVDTAWRRAVNKLPVGDPATNAVTLSRCLCPKEEFDQVLMPIIRFHWTMCLTRIEKACGLDFSPLSPIVPAGKNSMVMTKECLINGTYKTICVITEISSRLPHTGSFPLTTSTRMSGLLPI